MDDLSQSQLFNYLGQGGGTTPPPPAGAPPAPFDWYKYAILANLLGSTGSALGQVFRPSPPPQPVAGSTPFYKAPEITAPNAMQTLMASRRNRGGG